MDIVKVVDLLDWGIYLLELLILYDKEFFVFGVKSGDMIVFFLIVENWYCNYELVVLIVLV